MNMRGPMYQYYSEQLSDEEAKEIGNYTVYGMGDPRIFKNIVPIKNPILKTFISGILEITSGFTRIKLYTVSPINDILMLTFTSLASFSIIMQIKSILKETKFDSKYFYTSRILTLFISLLIYLIT